MVAWAITYFVASSLDVAGTAAVPVCCKLNVSATSHGFLDNVDTTYGRYLVALPLRRERETRNLALDVHLDEGGRWASRTAMTSSSPSP